MNRRDRAPVFEPLELRQLLSAGDLDPTFGDAGKVLTDQGLGSVQQVVVQRDGKIVAAVNDDRYQAFTAVRYNPDGTLDSTFGDAGVASHDLGEGEDFARNIAVLPDGRIVLAGSSEAHGHRFAVAMLNPDGSLDTTFGDGGFVFAKQSRTGVGNGAMAVAADGSILLAITTGVAENEQDIGIVRITPDGRVDDSFGDHGLSHTDLGGVDLPNDLALQADGKIVVAASRYVVPSDGTRMQNRGAYVLRFNPDGSPDATFGTAGVVSEDLAGQEGVAMDVAVGMDGRITFLGSVIDPGRHLHPFLVRYNPDGMRDTTFGTAGKAELGTGMTAASNLLVQPDGKILLGGAVVKDGYEPGYGPSLFAAWRFNPDGSADTGYGDDGITRVAVATNSDVAWSAALQPDGNLVLAGTSFGDAVGQDLALVRLHGDRGAAGSRFATLRRGIDQQAEYTGKAPARRPHRSPKRRAMEEAARQRKKHRSPKRRAQDLALQRSAATAATTFTAVPTSSVFNATRAIDPDDSGVLG